MQKLFGVYPPAISRWVGLRCSISIEWHWTGVAVGPAGCVSVIISTLTLFSSPLPPAWVRCCWCMFWLMCNAWNKYEETYLVKIILTYYFQNEKTQIKLVSSELRIKKTGASIGFFHDRSFFIISFCSTTLQN